MIVGKVSNNFRNKIISKSRSRGQSSNYRKLRGDRAASSRRAFINLDHQFNTTKISSSRNRSISSKSKFILTNKLAVTRRASGQISKLRSNFQPSFGVWEPFEVHPNQTLTMQDVNSNKININTSKIKEWNFTMTDESEVNTILNKKRPRKVKWFKNVKLMESSNLNQTVKYSFRNRPKISARII